MEKDTQIIERLYMKRIDLYRDLLSCIKRERENLINQDLKGIWNGLEEKNEILHSINDINSRLDGLNRDKSKDKSLTTEEKQTVISLSRTLNALKEEIGVRLKENICFIRDTLGFINDIFSVFAGNARMEKTYGPSRNRQSETGNLLYNNEA